MGRVNIYEAGGLWGGYVTGGASTVPTHIDQTSAKPLPRRAQASFPSGFWIPETWHQDPDSRFAL